jgi:UDP-N-acetylglucosamine 2-epimerase (non-hydrolysing)
MRGKGVRLFYSPHQNIKIANDSVKALNDLHLKPKEYFLVTAHRQENVDIKERFEGIIEGLELVADEFRLPIVYPN